MAKCPLQNRIDCEECGLFVLVDLDREVRVCVINDIAVSLKAIANDLRYIIKHYFKDTPLKK